MVYAITSSKDSLCFDQSNNMAARDYSISDWSKTHTLPISLKPLHELHQALHEWCLENLDRKHGSD
jgi:hypothetical protein